MGASTVLIVFVAAIAAAWLGLRAYRRAPTSMGKLNRNSEVGNPVEQWGVRIDAPAKERACPRVRELLEREYPIDAKPRLPVPGCPFSNQCECRYVKLFDRRKGERRSGKEQQPGGQRFDKDKPTQRSGKDRRKNKLDWF